MADRYGIRLNTTLVHNLQKKIHEVKKAQEFSESVLSAMPDGVAIILQDGTISYMNQAFQNAFGKEAAGKRCCDIFREETSGGICPLDRHITLGKSYAVEARNVAGDKHYYVSLRGIELQEGGKGYLAVFKDISSLKAAEQELFHMLESEKLVADIFGRLLSLPSSDMAKGLDYALQRMVAFLDVDYAKIFCCMDDGNSFEEQFCWHSRKSGQACAFASALHNASWLSEKLRAGDMIQVSGKSEFPAGAKAEKAFFSKVRVKSLLIAPMSYYGTVFGFLAIGTTQRKQAFEEKEMLLIESITDIIASRLVHRRSEEELAASEEKYSQLVENAKDGILFVQKGIVRYVNSALQQMLGYGADELVGQPFLTGLADDKSRRIALDIFRKNVTARSRRAISKNYDLKIQTKDSALRYIEACASIITYMGKPAVMAVLRDVTDKRKTELLQNTLSYVSTCFAINSDINESIMSSLEEIGRLADASRAYLFIYDLEKGTMSNTHEWCAKGVRPQMKNMQSLSIDEFPWWRQKMGIGELIHLEDVSKMPDNAILERKILEKQGIKSLLVFPVYVDQKVSGFMGFDNVKNTGLWSDDDIHLLEEASKIFGFAIARHKRVRALNSVKECMYKCSTLLCKAEEHIDF